MGAGHAHALYIHEHSRVHELAPEVKVGGVLLFVISVAITPREALWAFAFYLVVALGVVFFARVPIRFLVLRLVGIVPFILFAFFIPFVSSGDRIDVLWFSVSRDGLWAAFGIVAKATIGAIATITLVATTEVPGILRGMSKLKVPGLIVAIAGFMIRYAELIVEELGRMRMAMTARGYQPRWLGHLRPIATGAGAMFVRSYERGERVHAAMVSRGFTGTIPVIVEPTITAADWAKGLMLPVVALVIALVSLVVL